MRHVILILLCYLLSGVYATAQVPEKAAHHFDKALRFEAKKNRTKACMQMEQAIALYPAYADAYSILAQWYFQSHQFGPAANALRRAMRSCPKGDKLFAKPFARCLVYNSETDSALFIIDNYGRSDDKEWAALRSQAIFIRQAMRGIPTYEAMNMGVRINTTDGEMFPSISADTQTLYFTRRVNNMDEDLYYAVPDSCGGWFSGRSMGYPLNTLEQETSQNLSADGHYQFITRCGVHSENGWANGDCDLFIAYRSDSSEWSVPQGFGATINTPDYEGMPCISPDSRNLYFSSNRPGGYGGFDIWMSHFEDGLWSQPRNLGPAINTAGNETAPFLATDNKTLYFASTGHTGMGGQDLFISKKLADTIWSQASNMGYPINTTADENSGSVSIDGQTMYFASDRSNMAGDFDIYRIQLPQTFQPQPIGCVKGYVYDSTTKERLNYASIYIDDLYGRRLYHFTSNRGDASYTMILPPGTYVSQTARIGYTEVPDTFTVSTEQLYIPLEFNISMLPSDYIAPINDSLLLTIHFPVNSTRLNDTDKVMIRAAITPWLLEKGFILAVNSYTDNTGTPIINEQLSQTRANAVAKELTTYGIDEINIQARGWGEANMIAPNDTEAGREMNRRVEIIIRR